MPQPAEFELEQQGQDALLHVRGDWLTDTGIPRWPDKPESDSLVMQELRFDASALGQWDSALILYLAEVKRWADEHGVRLDLQGMPAGAQQLLELAFAVPERQGARKHAVASGLLTRVGESVLQFASQSYLLLGFIGEVLFSFLRLLLGRARFSGRDLALFIQEAGFEALPIVSLISFLIGVILAFVGAYQLQLFGAEVYVANLVAVGATREMAPIMAAVIMSGRTGAAYAAQLGTMQVNEEVDAFRTLGISPIDYLVLPRVLALTLMLPMLVLYADVLGILGGLLVGINLFDIPIVQYINQTLSSLNLTNIFLGVFKGALFGLLIGASGTFQGMMCGRSSAAVGQAATQAVVMSIVGIVVVDSVMAIISTLAHI